jgi:hypothetical protein
VYIHLVTTVADPVPKVAKRKLVQMAPFDVSEIHKVKLAIVQPNKGKSGVTLIPPKLHVKQYVQLSQAAVCEMKWVSMSALPTPVRKVHMAAGDARKT